MTIQRKTTTWPTILLLLVLAGCAGFSSLEEPKVTLADIQIKEVKRLETAFLVQLRIMNPNTTPLEVEGLSCDVELDGRKFASGLQGGQTTIPAYGSVLVPMEVYASVVDMFTSALGVLKNQNEADGAGRPISYRLKGNVRVSSRGFSHNLPFRSTGEVKL